MPRDHIVSVARQIISTGLKIVASAVPVAGAVFGAVVAVISDLVDLAIDASADAAKRRVSSKIAHCC